jgi:hypothetical protein
MERDRQNTKLFSMLAKKDILEILDGDTEVCRLETEVLKMPYLTGPAIVEMLNTFGYPCSYPASGAQSRWMYMETLVKHCCDNNRGSDLLAYLFDSSRFGEAIKGLGSEDAKRRISLIRASAIDRINALLYLSGYELKSVGSKFYITASGDDVFIEAPAIRSIDRDYVSSLAERINRDIDNMDLDSAVTKSRTLLEEVFMYVIEKRGEAPSEKGDIGKLFSQVKSLYNMHQSPSVDKRVNELISGLEKIVRAIGEMRNKQSDAHGAGSKRVVIDDYHARLMANSAIVVADFILSVAAKANEETST